MADENMTVLNEDRTLNEVLSELGYATEPDPRHRPGVKMILAMPGRVEVFRGRTDDVWAWLRRCPTCEFRGYPEAECPCGGTGVRPEFQQPEPTPLTWRRGTYDVATSVPSMPELGHRDGLISDCGLLGVAKLRRGYSLDHIPTGRRVYFTRTQAEAKELGERIADVVRANRDVDHDDLADSLRAVMTAYLDATRGAA